MWWTELLSRWAGIFVGFNALRRRWGRAQCKIYYCLCGDRKLDDQKPVKPESIEKLMAAVFLGFVNPSQLNPSQLNPSQLNYFSQLFLCSDFYPNNSTPL